MCFWTDGTTQRKMRGKTVIVKNRAGVVTAGKWMNLIISNGDMDDIIRIKKLLENSDVLIDGVCGTVKHGIKNNKGDFLTCY